MYPADDGRRNLFVLGNVILKSSHLHEEQEIDYSFADANEVAAISVAENVLSNTRKGSQVLVSQLHPYICQSQKQSFKKQARVILRQLHTVKPKKGCEVRSHVVQNPGIFSNGRINPAKGEIVFSVSNTDPDLGFMHNGFTPSNIILDNDKIV
ncbi:hypothetical protein AJ79_09391 [Helicocarpus griseus UAMH5409]|uniref:Uncharacterized protein n=1 Tax=Helicocarpus griseus UAMH5409 TaxID=1447875 RepID=A0A2B7WK84_9EURO|nr:hypothetical protein AJ79_09391 [Helicocarpus griseus UAMH5409]